MAYRVERDPVALLSHVPAIRTLADAEKEALGFLPEVAYREAIERRRLIAMLFSTRDSAELAGFILFSGVFPNARVQQIVVAPRHRRARVASALVNTLVAQLESLGYLTISAAVADDLDTAQAFYERNEFRARASYEGGQARGRKIVLRARDLDSQSLLSLLEPRPASAGTLDFGLRQRSAQQAPLYAFDLNVLFDVAKSRSRAPVARRIIAAGLAHQVRLAVAPEFVVELERHSSNEDADPILQLARQLPRLPGGDPAATERLAKVIHGIVFVESGSADADSVQALSDARHLAEAALARASGYLTSDQQLLAAREALFQRIGIDVAGLDEFAELLPVETSSPEFSRLRGTDCAIKSASKEDVEAYLTRWHIPATLISEFCPEPRAFDRWHARVVFEGDEIVAVAVSLGPINLDASTRVLVHVRPDQVACETFADHLIDTHCEEACRSGPMTIELPLTPGQTIVRRAAALRGFFPIAGTDTLIKVALGRPMTATTWGAIARHIRRKTGLRLPVSAPEHAAIQSGIVVQSPDGKAVTARLTALEDALSPTILIWPGRDGVIVPITRNFADELLGTGDQLLLFGTPEASFVRRRTYFNTPRAAMLMRPGVPILFYESKRSGGRGAIVAAARVVEAMVLPKREVSDDLIRRAVIEDLDPLSSSLEVLATSFDSLLRFPIPVTLEKLREMAADGSANLQTATVVHHAALAAIMDLGWHDR